MPDFLSIPKAKQAASTVFGLAGTAYRFAMVAAVGALVAHQIAGPAGVLVGALAVILAASLFPPSRERAIAVFVAVTVASYAITDPALAQAGWVMP
jgi:hypothetical protein